MRKLVVLTAVFAAVSGFILVQGARRGVGLYEHPPTTFVHMGPAGSWFERAKPYCNTVEAETWLRRNPPPDGLEGTGYAAACHALAGRIDAARAEILTLAPEDRWRGAGIVFGVGHPVADAGDDLAAGPIMELVVEFWPNHYMALYHAGASRYQLGEYAAARRHLDAFLVHYEPDDGWRRNAERMLDAMAD